MSFLRREFRISEKEGVMMDSTAATVGSGVGVRFFLLSEASSGSTFCTPSFKSGHKFSKIIVKSMVALITFFSDA